MGDENTDVLIDKVTSLFKMATDILFVRNPVSTGMGVLFGGVLHFLVNLFSPLLDQVKVISFATVNLLHYIALGVFGFNINNLRKRNRVSEAIEAALKLINENEEKRLISNKEAIKQRKELISTAVETAKINAMGREAAKK